MADGIESNNRDLLERLHRSFEGPFTPADAAAVLSLEQPRARRLLAYLASRGWLSRVRRGLYTTVPLGATSPSDWREDPWIVAASTFAPCYIGGWSACEHWGLTEQVFRDIVVITARAVRSTMQTVQGTPFLIKQRAEQLHFGTRTIWRNRLRLLVSDPSRTVADILDDPSLGGGLRHITEVIGEYLDGEHRDTDTLLKYLERQGNRTAFKRLGYILETTRREPKFAELCRERISTGLSALDPSVKRKGTISKRWNLRVNVGLDAS
ncbi:MAG: type IV toxin-antitoxin system AbiEi family antitoxin domain-containing protein [Phycisphaeraceae bacterium]|nr:type IV toxin-antitoxin system AbiEi family antitoxin domain-containing protein [Phycisphaeraceae bacterium]